MTKALACSFVHIPNLKQSPPSINCLDEAPQKSTGWAQYLLNAVKKPAYVSAMILDPPFKISFWKKKEPFIMDYLHISVDNILETFRELETYNKPHPQQNPSASLALPSNTLNQQSSFFSSKLYDTTEKENQHSVHAELSLYLKEELEPEGTNILKYWFVRKNKLPTLSKMVQIYLAIPATSAASECVLSKGQRIVSWQQSSLNPEVVEELLCIKEWTSALMVASNFSLFISPQ
ncbi:uncharacterized protein VP01_8306g2, partial [Puccinia sorghi]